MEQMIPARAWTSVGNPGFGIQNTIDNFGTMIAPYNPTTFVIALGRNDYPDGGNGSGAGALAVTLVNMIKAAKPNANIRWVSTAIWVGENWVNTPPLQWNNGSSDALMDNVNASLATSLSGIGIPFFNPRPGILIDEQIYNTSNLASGVLSSDGTHGTALGYYLMCQLAATTVAG
jgi:hypothetical protein